jgi:ribosome recycling factor
MAYNFSPLKTRVKEIEEWLVGEYSSIRTGRATPALLDSVNVESYGARTPLKHVGSITIEDPRTLRVTLWDKTQVKAAESAIASANLGVSAVADGMTIRVTFPELTAEKRKLLNKLAGEKLEEAKITLRKEREKTWNDIQAKEKEGGMSEDDKFRNKDELQKIIDEATAKFAEHSERKETEILQ